MTWVNQTKWINEEAQIFEANSIALSEKLLTSENGQSREYWQAEIFKTLSTEQITTWDNEKTKIFEGGNANIRKTHRPDLD